MRNCYVNDETKKLGNLFKSRKNLKIHHTLVFEFRKCKNNRKIPFQTSAK